jgi:hypothetical protein
MDPDKALADLRDLAKRRNAVMAEWQEVPDDVDGSVLSEEMDELAHDIARGFEALDEWLAKGGTLPLAWGAPVLARYREIVGFVKQIADMDYQAIVANGDANNKVAMLQFNAAKLLEL